MKPLKQRQADQKELEKLQKELKKLNREMNAGKGLGGGIAQRFGWMAQAAGMIKAPVMSRVGSQSLSAQDPLSREGNAQRVRSLAQNGQKIAEKQLTTQKQMLGELRGIRQNSVQLVPMGLG